MSKPVNAESGAGASRRGEQARATRRRIVDAAAELFIERGYAATTLEQVAGRAGVAVQTVYFHFGNKQALLKQAVDIAAVGDDEPVPLLDRPWLEQARAEPDPHRVIALWIRNSCEILGRVGPIMRVVRDAAGASPDTAAQWDTNEQQRMTAFRVLAQMLADRRALQPGVPVDEAADIIFALVSIELYLLLTVNRGWAPARWERWTTAMLTSALLSQ
ncbi:MAG TPA: helix-turn-helix domain-containing protein [Streptosporangiaceae bacterium]|jgi:AcrR family transcriptional regulator|nr:helix-turn-helix domain-containing protein [Streptosporangiaceae bacterium]